MKAAMELTDQHSIYPLMRENQALRIRLPEFYIATDVEADGPITVSYASVVL
jgi:hypothetical protein